MVIDMAYFTKEFLEFKGIIGLKKYTRGQIFDALQGLLNVRLKLQNNSLVSDKDKDFATSLMKTLMHIELPMVMTFRESKGIK